MNLSKIFLSILFLFTIVSCETTESGIIKDDMVLEFRNNNWVEFKNSNWSEVNNLVILDIESEKFKKLQAYFNDLKGFKETDYINIYPSYTILSKDLKILIAINKIDLEYKNDKNKIIKLTKDFKAKEFSDFKYLLEDNYWIKDFGNIYGKGKITSDKYTFCGLVPEEIKYEYKVEKWKFWNLDRELIAEGEFKTDSTEVYGRGGCSYYIKTSKIDKENWNFYSLGKKITELTIEEKFAIENARK